MANDNPIQVQKYLKGADYPARKGELIKLAERNNAPDQVFETLSNIPEKEYISPAHVTKAIGEMM